MPHSTLVQFGNGSNISTSLAAQLNRSLTALVIPDTDLIQDLLSVTPILDLGYEISLSSQGGSINLNGEPIMPIIRNDKKLLVDIKSVQCLSASTSHQAVRERVLAHHKRTGHPSMRRMIDAINCGSWTNCDVTSHQVKEIMKQHSCIACIMGKQNHSPIPKSPKDTSPKPIGWLVSGDIIGPVTPASKNGARYFFLFVEATTGHLYNIHGPD